MVPAQGQEMLPRQESLSPAPSVRRREQGTQLPREMSQGRLRQVMVTQSRLVSRQDIQDQRATVLPQVQPQETPRVQQVAKARRVRQAQPRGTQGHQA